MYGKPGREATQIKMAIYDLPNATTGIDSMLLQVMGEVTIFIPMFLLFIFCVILIGGITKQKRRLGNADIPMWVTLASLGTLMVSMPLTLTTGLIEPEYLAILVVITIISGLWLFLDRSRNEI